MAYWLFLFANITIVAAKFNFETIKLYLLDKLAKHTLKPYFPFTVDCCGIRAFRYLMTLRLKIKTPNRVG